MQCAISRWGNSLALRLPKSIAKDSNLSEGTTVEVYVENHKVVIAPKRRKYRLSELLEGYKPSMRHGEVDWGDPIGREEL